MTSPEPGITTCHAIGQGDTASPVIVFVECRFDFRRLDGVPVMTLDEIARFYAQQTNLLPPKRRFRLGDRVRSIGGYSWQGRVVGFYTTRLTPVGYAVESEHEANAVLIQPEAALEPVGDARPGDHAGS